MEVSGRSFLSHRGRSCLQRHLRKFCSKEENLKAYQTKPQHPPPFTRETRFLSHPLDKYDPDRAANCRKLWWSLNYQQQQQQQSHIYVYIHFHGFNTFIDLCFKHFVQLNFCYQFMRTQCVNSYSYLHFQSYGTF